MYGVETDVIPVLPEQNMTRESDRKYQLDTEKESVAHARIGG
jgi:hypothetical protein